MGQRNKQAVKDQSSAGEQVKLPPSVADSFVPLPPAGTRLSPEQLKAIFGDDMRALHDLARLAYQSGSGEAE
jgi:hypothetical protein